MGVFGEQVGSCLRTSGSTFLGSFVDFSGSGSTLHTHIPTTLLPFSVYGTTSSVGTSFGSLVLTVGSFVFFFLWVVGQFGLGSFLTVGLLSVSFFAVFRRLVLICEMFRSVANGVGAPS